MKFYKIRHIPSGLFWKPSRWPHKRNLSKTGKVYQTKATLRWLPTSYNHPIESDDGWNNWERRSVNLDEWEVVELNVENVNG